MDKFKLINLLFKKATDEFNKLLIIGTFKKKEYSIYLINRIINLIKSETNFKELSENDQVELLSIIENKFNYLNYDDRESILLQSDYIYSTRTNEINKKVNNKSDNFNLLKSSVLFQAFKGKNILTLLILLAIFIPLIIFIISRITENNTINLDGLWYSSDDNIRLTIIDTENRISGDGEMFGWPVTITSGTFIKRDSIISLSLRGPRMQQIDFNANFTGKFVDELTIKGKFVGALLFFNSKKEHKYQLNKYKKKR